MSKTPKDSSRSRQVAHAPTATPTGSDRAPGKHCDYRTVHTTCEAAKLSLEHIGEWAKWMAGIQTAALAGLASLLVDDTKKPIDLRPAELVLTIASFVFLALALLLSAWVLSAVASLALRVGGKPPAYRDDTPNWDIYTWPSFTWMGARRVPFGVLMGLQHWCWGFGLFALAGFSVLHFGGSMLVRLLRQWFGAA